MFGLTPFERKSYDLFNAFHDFENDFFGENALQSFKTDIKDEGDKYVMEAELPGFDKDDIKLLSFILLFHWYHFLSSLSL